MLKVREKGVPDGYVAARSRQYGVLLHRLRRGRRTGRTVCGRVRPPWLPSDDARVDGARICGSCVHIEFLTGPLDGAPLTIGGCDEWAANH